MSKQPLSQYEEELLKEIRQIPPFYLPNLLKVVQSLKDSVSSQQERLKEEKKEYFDFEIRQLESIYEFSDSLEVTDYLKAYPFLIELLFEAFPEIERFFGKNPRVILKVANDPDIEGENQLFAYIHTTLSPKEALNRMDRLDEEWFLNQIDRTKGKFNFNLEFV